MPTTIGNTKTRHHLGFPLFVLADRAREGCSRGLACLRPLLHHPCSFDHKFAERTNKTEDELATGHG
jgi:hypothetical protein